MTFDYERFPNLSARQDREHPSEECGSWREGLPRRRSRPSSGTPPIPVFPQHAAGRALFAVDELCGFLVACALVRVLASLADLEVASVKKKLRTGVCARGEP
jgi:hypothetical protein